MNIMPSSANSFLYCTVNIFNAALEVLYAPAKFRSFNAIDPKSELMLIIFLIDDAQIRGRKARIIRWTPTTLVSKTIRRESTDVSRIERPLSIPALLIRTSTFPDFSDTIVAAPSTDSSEVTSHCTIWRLSGRGERKWFSKDAGFRAPA